MEGLEVFQSGKIDLLLPLVDGQDIEGSRVKGNIILNNYLKK